MKAARIVRHAIFAALVAVPALTASACASSDGAWQAEQAAPETATGPASWPVTRVWIAPELRAACGDRLADGAFELSAAKVSDAANRRLGDLADCLGRGALRGRGVELVGYADPRSATEYDTSVAVERAKTVAAELQRRGLPPGCVEVQALDPRLEDLELDALPLARRVDVRLADGPRCR